MKYSIVYIIGFLLMSLSSNAQTVSFQLNNEQIIDQPSDPKYQFDVEMSYDQAGLFHSRGLIYLVYDLVSFGQDIVLNGNVEVEPIGQLGGQLGSTDLYTTINIADNTSNVLAITYEATFLNADLSTGLFNEASTSFSGLYRITIPIADISGSRQICFEETLMEGQFFHSLGSGAELPFPTPYFYVGSCDDIVLSTELVTFSGVLEDEGNLLTWTIGDATTLQYFELQRRLDDGTFETVSTILPTQELSYHFLDRNYPSSGPAYYRLELVDVDRSIKHSKLVVLTRMESQTELNLAISPNPTGGSFQLKIDPTVLEDATIRIIDVMGRPISPAAFQPNTDGVTIDLQGNPPGIYYLPSIHTKPNFRPL